MNSTQFARALDLLDHLFEPLLELSSILGARYQGSHVQSYQPLALEGLGDIARGNTLGQGFNDGRLAHPWLSHEDGVVLGPPAQYLDDPLDLLVPPDDGV